MPAWMEKIKDTFTAKADLKSLFIVLQPDNQVSTVMVVSYVRIRTLFRYLWI